MRHWQKWAAPSHQIQHKPDPVASKREMRRTVVVFKLMNQGFTRLQAEKHYAIYGVDAVR